MPRFLSVSPFSASLGRVVALALTVAGAAWPAHRAQAQTAHFLGAAPVTLPSGSAFSGPLGVAFDRHGNVFVADSGDSAVKEIPLNNGVYGAPITLPSGSGFGDPYAVAVDAAGDVFVADYSENAVWEIPFTGGGYGTPFALPSGSGFIGPQGIAVDAEGNVYVADSGNHAVKKIAHIGGKYVAPVGIGSTISNPIGVAVDENGNVVVADAGSNTIRQIPLSGGLYGAPVTLSSGFIGLDGVAVEGSGNLFVTDAGNNTVNELSCNGSICGAPVLLGSGFESPAGIAVDGRGNIFVADSANNAIKEVSPAVNFGSVAVNTSTPATQTLTFRIDSATGGDTLGPPSVLTLGAAGLDYTDAGTGTCDTNGNRHPYNPGDTCTVVVKLRPKHAGARYGAVELVSAFGAVLATAYLHGVGLGAQVAFLPTTESIVASGFSDPQEVAVDGNGNLFVANSASSSVDEFPWNGSSYGSAVQLPQASTYIDSIAVDGAGNLFSSDAYSSGTSIKAYVDEFPFSGGSYGMPIVLLSDNDADHDVPVAMTVDGSGNLFVIEYYPSIYVREIPFSGGSYGQPITLPWNTAFGVPVAIAVDAGGNVFLVDTNNNVDEIPFSGGSYGAALTLVALPAPAQNGYCSFDGGSNNACGGIAVDGMGNLFVANSDNGTLNEIPLIDGNYGQAVTIGRGLVPTFLNSLATLGVTVDSSGNVYVANSGNNNIAKVDLADPPTLKFPTPTRIGESDSTDDPESFSLLNIGNENLTYGARIPIVLPATTTSFGFDGATTCDLTGSLLPGASCSFGVDFEPLAIGANSGSILITSNASISGTTIPLSGTGVPKPPAIFASFSPATISAGGVSALTFKLENPAANNVSLTSIAFGDTLPSGLVASTSGVTDTCPNTYSLPLLILINGSSIAVSGAKIPSGSIATAGFCTITVNVTGTTPGTYTNTTGAVSSDNGGTGGTATATLTVLAPITITPATLAAGTVGSRYAVHFGNVGGSPHFTWSISSGTPPGLSMDANGELSGVPTASGTYNFTVTVTSSKGGSGSQAYTLAIN